MGRTVLLRHHLPDGTSHFDWLLETSPGGPLMAFRLQARIDRPDAVAFRAERIPDHRAVYLDYQGSVSGNRGTVERIAAGTASFESSKGLSVTIDFGSGRRRLIGTPERGGDGAPGAWWEFCSDPLEPDPSAR